MGLAEGACGDGAVRREGEEARSGPQLALIPICLHASQNVPADQGIVATAASRIGFVQRNLYGDVFDVRVEPSPVNVAYTDAELKLHTVRSRLLDVGCAAAV